MKALLSITKLVKVALIQITQDITYLAANFFDGLIWTILNSPKGIRRLIHFALTPYRTVDALAREIAKLWKRKPEYTIELTEKTLTYGGQVYQLSNITYIGKRKLVKSNWLGVLARKLFLVVVVTAVCIGYLISIPEWYPLSLLAIPLAIILLVNIAYGVYMNLLLPVYFVKLETAAASTELFMSKDESFIDELVIKIRDNINKPDPRISYVFNTIDKSVEIDTGGGSYIAGDVRTSGGDFIGRDKSASE